MNWETNELIDWLLNDPSECLSQVQGLSPQELRAWVTQGFAPKGLYESFARPPVSSFDSVDWNAVYQYVND